MNLRHLIVVLVANLICVTSFAQVEAHFEVRNGATYAVLVNHGSYTASVSWRCVNYQTGEFRDGSINLLAGYETVIGPNINWYWMPGEQFLYRVGNSSNGISFKGGNSKIKNSCHIRSHDCAFGIDENGDGWCDNCMRNGHKCHMVDHSPR